MAITRARHGLDLIAPLKFYVAQQARFGDTHVYGTRSRFLTSAVLQTFDAVTWPMETRVSEPSLRTPLPRIDAAKRLRDFWT